MSRFASIADLFAGLASQRELWRLSSLDLLLELRNGLDQAASACNIGALLNMGQCSVTSCRIAIHEDTHDAFVEQVVAMARRLRTQRDVAKKARRVLQALAAHSPDLLLELADLREQHRAMASPESRPELRRS